VVCLPLQFGYRNFTHLTNSHVSLIWAFRWPLRKKCSLYNILLHLAAYFGSSEFKSRSRKRIPPSISFLISRSKFCDNAIIETMTRKYVLTIWSEHNYIFSHRIVHWVYNYMFRPCVLAIFRIYYNLNKQLYNMCVGYSGGNEISSYSSEWHGLGPLWTVLI
jgi:hypothetical protein